METKRIWVGWLAAVVAGLAFLLPALTIAAPPAVAEQHWSGLKLAGSGLNTARGAGDNADAYSRAADRLTFVSEISQRQQQQAATGDPGAPSGVQVIEVSGIFRLARYVPVELLAAAACLVALILGMALRAHTIAFTAAGLGVMFAVFAIILFAWLGGAAKAQWHLALPGSGAPVHLGPALFVLLVAFITAMIAVHPAPEPE